MVKPIIGLHRIEKTNKKLKLTKDFAESLDKDAAWLNKGGKYRFGYKKHHLTDNEGLVL